MTTFDANEWQRYQRHMQLEGFAVAGQTRLKGSRVLIVGAGGLGCPAALYLAAAGVGHITLVDADTVCLSNLHRQILYTPADIGLNKALVARQKLLLHNPCIEVVALSERLRPDNARELIQQADIVLDCSDNFATRYLINDNCVNSRIPWIYASVLQFAGQVALFTPGQACFRCIFPQVATDIPDCNAAGVLGVMPGMLALLQSNECIKYLACIPSPLRNRLLLVDGMKLTFRNIGLSKDACCVCQQPIDTADHLQDYGSACQLDPLPMNSVEGAAFIALSGGQNVLLVDVRRADEHQAFNIGGSNIPLEDNFSQHFSDKSLHYLLYCQSGSRSSKGAALLLEQGFTQVSSLAGGLARLID